MNVLINKFKEVLSSVLPITIIVVILHFTLVPMETTMFYRFLIGSIFVILGLGIFLFGAELGISPIGNLMGEAIAKTNKAAYVAILGFVLGFLINIAEPDIQILSQQVSQASGGTIPASLILIVVSVGVGIMVAIGLLRILYGRPLNRLFTVVYAFILLLGIWVSEEFLAISVDASGATTGAMTTPFILALGYGVSQLKGGETSEEDSFGMVGLASGGPIFAIMLMSIISGIKSIAGQADSFIPHKGVLAPYIREMPILMKESVITLAPLLILFLIFNYFKFKLDDYERKRILKGLLYTYIGLSLFLTGVNAGFMEVGRVMGQGVASLDQAWILPLIGFILGMVVVLAEPAVYVLTEQVEEVTAGHIKRKVILVALSLGIAFAVSMSMLRIMLDGLRLWYFLLPGFALGLYLSYRVPPIFVGIAYDSGGVASGPMTATFILAFAQGAATALPNASFVDGFGVIAMVAMTPIVAIQLLGLIFNLKSKKEDELLDG